jgi:hypothetical protein
LDWKTVFSLKTQGKHFLPEGKKILFSICNRMNQNRLSTNQISNNKDLNLENKIKDFLDAPSNYEKHPNGKIFIKSSGLYLKGRGNINVKMVNEQGLLVHSFDSILDFSSFFNLIPRTILRKLDNGENVTFKNCTYYIKRTISLDI